MDSAAGTDGARGTVCGQEDRQGILKNRRIPLRLVVERRWNGIYQDFVLVFG
jgi:hypothetical protein